MKVKSEKWKWSRSVVSDSGDPMDCSLPGSSIHGIFQARVLEWGAIAFSEVVLKSQAIRGGPCNKIKSMEEDHSVDEGFPLTSF